MKIPTLCLIIWAGALGACTTTGNMERNAGAGAAIGAIAGAVIGNNTGSGDAGNGAVRGYSLDQRRDECATSRRGPTYRDRNGAYYYVIPDSNRTCWVRDQSPRGL